MSFFLEEMGWVEIYEYDLGFCNLRLLIELHPNENDFDDRYILGAYWINWKKNPSIEALTFEGTIHILNYLNLFNRFKISIAKELVKGGKHGGNIRQLVTKYLVI
jgi:hypothetical protein